MTPTRATLLSAVVVAGLYAIRAVLAGDPAGAQAWNDWFLREDGLLDRSEAILWLAALVLNVRIAAAVHRRRGRAAAFAWYAGMTVLSVLALGEEVSWGQHVFGYRSETVAAVNAQHETNVHNLNVSLLLGLPPAHPLHWVLSNLNRVLNPAFYVLTAVLWVLLPAARRLGAAGVLRDVPMPRPHVSVFFAVNGVAFVLIDQLVFDVAEIFEYAIASTFAVGAFDVFTGVRVPVSPAVVVGAPARAAGT